MWPFTPKTYKQRQEALDKAERKRLNRSLSDKRPLPLLDKDGTLNQEEWDKQLKEAIKGITIKIS